MSDLDRTDDASLDTEPSLVIDPAVASEAANPQGVGTTPHTTPDPVTIPPSVPVSTSSTAVGQAHSDEHHTPPATPAVSTTPPTTSTSPLAAPTSSASEISQRPESERQGGHLPRGIVFPSRRSYAKSLQNAQAAAPSHAPTEPARFTRFSDGAASSEVPETQQAEAPTPHELQHRQEELPALPQLDRLGPTQTPQPSQAASIPPAPATPPQPAPAPTPSAPPTPPVMRTRRSVLTQPSAPTQPLAPAQSTPPQRPKQPLDMWAVVRDSDTSHAQASASKTHGKHLASPEQSETSALTGEVAQMTAPDGADSSSPIAEDSLRHDEHEVSTTDVSASTTRSDAERIDTGRGPSTHAIPQLLPQSTPSASEQVNPADEMLPVKTGTASSTAFTPLSHAFTASTPLKTDSPADPAAAQVVPDPSASRAPATSASAASSLSEASDTATRDTTPQASTPETSSVSSSASEGLDSPSEGLAWPQSDKVGEESALDQTAIRRRSLITPTDEPQPEPEATWKPRETVSLDQDHTITTTPDNFDSQIFAGATVVPTVPQRRKWHVLSVIITLIVVPLMWYYMEDAVGRFTLNISQMQAGSAGGLSQRLLPLSELLGVIVGLVVVVECAVRSSVGAHVVGVVLTVLGLPWVLVPHFTADTIYPLVRTAFAHGPFLQNLGYHLQEYGYSGRLLLMGLALWAFGVISHRVRRRGRAEQSIRAQVEQLAPADAPTK